MTTYPCNGWVLLTAFDGVPVDPQPAAFDDREPPAGHYGLPIKSPDGKIIRGWYPPVTNAPPRDKVRISAGRRGLIERRARREEQRGDPAAAANLRISK